MNVKIFYKAISSHALGLIVNKLLYILHVGNFCLKFVAIYVIISNAYLYIVARWAALHKNRKAKSDQ